MREKPTGSIMPSCSEEKIRSWSGACAQCSPAIFRSNSWSSRRSSRTRAQNRVVAPPEVAAAHGLPEGAEVYARARLVKEGDQPTHTLTSYYRPEHVEGTRLVDPTPGPAGRGGGFRVLYDAGYEIDHMKEQLFARAATPDEVKQLQLPPGEPVVELHRTTYTAEAPS
ncbi:hypothetical protein SUDANB13_03128 [Streptomyces sp. enrichment culture]